MYPGTKYRKENERPNNYVPNNQNTYPSNNQNNYPPNNNQNTYPPNNNYSPNNYQGNFNGPPNNPPMTMPFPGMSNTESYDSSYFSQENMAPPNNGRFDGPLNFPMPNYDTPPNNFQNLNIPHSVPGPSTSFNNILPGYNDSNNLGNGQFRPSMAPHTNTRPDFMAPPPGQPTLDSGRNIEVSTCRENKKALLIGINYFKQRGQLRGCINDVQNIKKFICTNYGFKEQDMVILTDDQRDSKFVPNRANMIAAMKWLVQDVQPNDSLFFHFSGHGGQTEDLDGDEDDGFDETILPVDHENAGIIVDDELNAIMVRPLRPGIRLTAVFDSCHSGTALDLPYVYGTDGKLKRFNPVKSALSSLGNAGKNYLAGDVIKSFGALKSGLSIFSKGKKAEQISDQTRSTMADVIMFSGCKDKQTSADAHISGVGNTGAMSHALISCLTKNPYGYTYHNLLLDLRAFLRDKYSQKPVLSAGRPMDINSTFIM